MSKRKPMRFRKARSESKVRSKAARSGQRQRSKQAQVLALLRGPSGATIAPVITSWQQHTVRAFLAAVVRKKLGLKLESEKADGERVYRIVAGKAFRHSNIGPTASARRGIRSTRP